MQAVVEFFSGALLGAGIYLFFFKKKKGCLTGKTPSQKENFFRSLCGFEKTDNVFFREQYADLTRAEKKEFLIWLRNDTNNKKAIITALNIISELSKK